jgi:hypothetical protein
LKTQQFLKSQLVLILAMAPSATDATAQASPAATALQALPPPKDLSHLFSKVTRNRKPSNIKAFYKFMQIPGISNFAGGE